MAMKKISSDDFTKTFLNCLVFLSKSWLDIDRDELEVVLVVAVCPWLLLELVACLSEAILGSDAEFEADGWGFLDEVVSVSAPAAGALCQLVSS